MNLLKVNGRRIFFFGALGGLLFGYDTGVISGNCYRYVFTIADRVGNVSSPVTATAKVDTDAPSEDAAIASVTAMCERLLANPVIEDFEIESATAS